MGRPRKSHNSVPRKLTIARYERWRRGFSLADVSLATDIPLSALSEIERGTLVPSATDLQGLAQLYGYHDPQVLMREGVVVPNVEVPA